MRLGISSYTFTWAIGVPGFPPERPWTTIDLLEKASELGVSVVQFADNLPLDHLSPGELGRLKRRAEELGVSIEIGTRGVGHDHLRTYLRLATRLESPILRVVIDTADHHPTEVEVVDLLRSMMPEFEDAGVCLAIENHDRFKAGTFARMIERIDSPSVGICLDTVNSFGALEGPELVVDTLGPCTVNLHVKDFAIFRANQMMGFLIEGRPAGQGQLDVPWLLEKLRSLQRDPNAILELWTPAQHDLVASISTEDAWAQSSIDYLRELIPD